MKGPARRAVRVATSLTGAALLAGVAVPPAWAAADGGAEVVCRLADPRLRESSGLAVLGDRWWTHNDSGDGDEARLFALDEQCATVAVVVLAGGPVRDAEDLAAGRDDTGRPVLWLADIGDNQARRAAVVLRRVVVPELPPTVGGAPVEVRVPAVEVRLEYDDGPRDAEALLVDPAGGLAVVSKPLLGRPGVYVPDRPLPGSGRGRLERAGTVRLGRVAAVDGPGADGPAGPLSGGLVTGGAVAPDGSRVALRTYTAVHEWVVRPAERSADGRLDFSAVLGREPDAATPVPAGGQGEALAYASTTDLLLTREGAGTPVVRVPSVARPADGAAGSPGSPPSTGAAGGPAATAGAAPAEGAGEADPRAARVGSTGALLPAGLVSGGGVAVIWALWRRRRNARLARTLTE